MYRLVIATMQTIRAARSAANRILFLCMGACFPLPPRRAPRVLNAGEVSGAYSRLPRAGVLASLLLAQQMLGFEDDLSSLLPAAQLFEYEASCAADVCCPVPPHRAGEGGVDGVLAQGQRFPHPTGARCSPSPTPQAEPPACFVGRIGDSAVGLERREWHRALGWWMGARTLRAEASRLAGR